MDVEAFTDVAGAASMCPPLLSMHLSSHCFCKELELVNKVTPSCKAVHRPDPALFQVVTVSSVMLLLKCIVKEIKALSSSMFSDAVSRSSVSQTGHSSGIYC